jgi:hypothetical protein
MPCVGSISSIFSLLIFDRFTFQNILLLVLSQLDLSMMVLECVAVSYNT